jgi:hypothetical protein
MADSAAEPPRDMEDGGGTLPPADLSEDSMEKSVEGEKSASRPGSVAPSVRGHDDRAGDFASGEQVMFVCMNCFI